MTFSFNTEISVSNSLMIQNETYAFQCALNLNVPDLIRASCRIEIVTCSADFIQVIIDTVGRPLVRSYPIYPDIILEFEDLIVLFASTRHTFTEKKRIVSPSFYGRIDDIRRITSTLEALYPAPKRSSLDWFYLSDGRIESTAMKIEHKNIPCDSFFPWIKPNIAEFQSSFLDSEANVLLLIGEPGSGKSSFIRDFISRNDLSAAVTHDEDMMKKDSFFIKFINGTNDVLIVEDADIILRDRESGNLLMNKLLNASDGLIHTDKKIIFTANITHLDEIDSALIRPGRCFDALVFRELTHKEAVVAAQDAGLSEPDGPLTLAKLFAERQPVEPISRLGFSMPS